MYTLFSLLLVFVLAFLPAHAQNTLAEKAEVGRKVQIAKIANSGEPGAYRDFFHHFADELAKSFSNTVPIHKVSEGWLVVISYNRPSKPGGTEYVRVLWLHAGSRRGGELLPPVQIAKSIAEGRKPEQIGNEYARRLVVLLTAPVIPPSTKQ